MARMAEELQRLVSQFHYETSKTGGQDFVKVSPKVTGKRETHSPLNGHTLAKASF
jgi:hypothetical protein